MRKITYLMFAILSASCGSGNSDSYDVADFGITGFNGYIEQEARPNFIEFVELCMQSSHADVCRSNLKKFHSLTLKDKLRGVDEDVIGFCQIYQTGVRFVQLQNNFASKHSLQFKALVWHELGHCLMDLDHVDTKFSIMNSRGAREERLSASWAKLAREMFSSDMSLLAHDHHH